MRQSFCKAMIVIGALASLSACEQEAAQLQDAEAIGKEGGRGAKTPVLFADFQYEPLDRESQVRAIPDCSKAFDCKQDREEPLIRVSAAGDLTFDGKGIDADALPKIAESLREKGWGAWPVEPNPNADFGRVVPNLAVLASNQRLVLVNTFPHRSSKAPSAEASKALLATEGWDNASIGELFIRVGYFPSDDNCIAEIAGETMSINQISHKSFNALETYVQGNGGPGKIFENPDALRRIVVHIQAPQSTPWRCVAGAVFAVEGSGWPKVRLQVVGS